MANRYGIYQASSRSCVFYKQDQDGNQSTFNVFIEPKRFSEEKNKIIAFIDNEQMKSENWHKNEINDLREIIDAFGGWATDAPIVFELEAKKSLGNCLSSVMKKD